MAYILSACGRLLPLELFTESGLYLLSSTVTQDYRADYSQRKTDAFECIKRDGAVPWRCLAKPS